LFVTSIGGTESDFSPIDLNTDFTLGLIARLVGARRNNRGAVMPRHVGIGAVDHRLVKAAGARARLAVHAGKPDGRQAHRGERPEAPADRPRDDQPDGAHKATDEQVPFALLHAIGDVSPHHHRFRCTMRVDCGQLYAGTVIRPVVGEWQPRMPERLDDKELADWRASRNAIYQLAALIIGARLAVADG
jgi:hypothetical protein